MPNYLNEEDGRNLILNILNAAIKEGVSSILQNYFEECVCNGICIPNDCVIVAEEENDNDCFIVFKWGEKFYQIDYDYYYEAEGRPQYDMSKIYEVTPVIISKTEYIPKE